jgi:hypothetical protein
MRTLYLALLASSLTLFAAPTLALECANAAGGAAPGTPPDDSGDGRSTACGDSALAGGDYSTALGRGALSWGAGSTALGLAASANGVSCTALGREAFADAIGSTALGHLASASGDYSTALGRSASASGVVGAALGYFASASGSNSTALGRSALASGDRSTALGFRAYADQPGTIVLGAIAGVHTATEYADVAIGTTNPAAPLHIHRSDGTAQILVEETNLKVAPRVLFTLANPGNTKFAIEETSTGNTWAFTNSGYDFRVSLQGSGVIELRVDNFGDAYLAGLLFENSDRNAKTNVRTVDRQAILEKVTALPITRWAYKETPTRDHISPMAQDFRAAFGTGAKDTTLATMDVSGVAIASIQALNEKLEKQNTRLEEENRSLREELAQLRASLKEVAVLREQLQLVRTRIGLWRSTGQGLGMR